MKWSVKIQAGALQFVLFIGAVIAVLIMAFLLIAHTHSFFDKKTGLTVSVIQEADNGLAYALQKNMPSNGVLEMTAMEQRDITVKVEKGYWGIFEKYTSSAKQGAIGFSKTALVGGHHSKGISALYLRDRQRPLILAGDAKIVGNAFLPPQGVRMGNVSGNSYVHHRLIFGRELASTSSLPSIREESLQQIEKLISGHSNGEDRISLKPDSVLKNSFENPTYIIRGEILHLDGVSLTGNIMIVATRKITVESSAQLRDVVLVAPEIVIKDWVKGVFQAIASIRISVGRNCELNYPTALVVQDKQPENKIENKENSQLFIDSDSVVNGLVVYLDNTEKQRYNPQIKISDNTSVRGEVYCTENLELRGSVIGGVYTDAFITLENGSTYQNHLYNGRINSEALPSAYAGLSPDGEQQKKVMKWLY